MAGLAPHQIDILRREGAFRGLQTLSRQGVSASEIRPVVVSVFKALQVEIAEARNELSRLQTSLGAMENACRSGAASPSSTGADPNIDRFQQSFITFDAWVVSLMETSLTIAGLMNPDHARKKVTEFASAMNALMDKRAAMKHPVMDDPSLFKGYVDR
jgi:hypothetical protein